MTFKEDACRSSSHSSRTTLRWFHFEFWFYQHTSCFSRMFHKAQTACIRNLLPSNDMRACAAKGIPDQNCTWLHQVRTAVHRAQLCDRAGPRTIQCAGGRARAADVTVFVIGTYFPGFRTEWSAIIYLYFAFRTAGRICIIFSQWPENN